MEKDLGPVALPRVPPSPQPFTVAEYFPTQGVTPFHDPRQHAVSLAYVVPVAGDCPPRQDALDLAWFSPRRPPPSPCTVTWVGATGCCCVRRWPIWVTPSEGTDRLPSPRGDLARVGHGPGCPPPTGSG